MLYILRKIIINILIDLNIHVKPKFMYNLFEKVMTSYTC